MSQRSPHVYLVIGGEGFLGRSIVNALLARINSSQPDNKFRSDIVRVLDIRRNTANKDDDGKIEFFIGDITKPEDVEAALTANGKNVNTVFHTASPIMKAPEKLHYNVNVVGTKNVLEVCRRCGVENFVYTSSASVVYSGEALVNVDESIPYANPFADYYSETKAIAEKMVLDANDSSKFRTVALRPSGIFGPGDRQATPGALLAQKRNFPVLIQVGDNTAKFDFTYVENLADAHLLAADKVQHIKEVGGEAFFITNDDPIGMWSFMRMLWSAVGDTRGPKLIIPTWLAGIILVVLRFLSSIGLVKHEVPFVFGMTFTDRYFNISKAKRLLGYTPRVSYAEGVPIAVEACLDRWKAEEESKKSQ
ncbi:erg26, C-3 sterol dehydrogenase [Mycoemilia scoparia]|uniref:Erg26, C-3 sterol dehydrogenase n=1 Tax=Mycoemilia scoparia TaxID=417184 RepID=A0A9W8A4R7_9FUNG|nr:erg26, C-3 sterol dehydrogenase [Mycoemilia scoparia]